VTRVLIVDDERQLLRGLRTNLLARGYTVDAAADGETALDLAARNRPDIVIVDLGLPGIDGLDVIRGLRAWTAVPIIVLSARTNEPEKIAALDAGADDYVTKPFGMGELLARLRAAERRVDRRPAPDERPIVRTDAFSIDLAAGKVADREGAQVHLTPTEWNLVEVFARHPGKLLTQRELLHEVWGPRYEDETNYLRVYMAQIRRKLEPEPATPRYFITEPGIGYRFESDPASSTADDGGA
jgi:two-component system KDP operon response regulator KdpE